MVYIVGSSTLTKEIYEPGHDGNFCPCSGRSLVKRCPGKKHDVMFSPGSMRRWLGTEGEGKAPS
jgi:hypothetical protein